jgi:PBSX family phage terminase large subunit
MKTIEHTLLPKQDEFLHAKERCVLYSGAFAAGKSRSLCFKLLARASVVGSREGLCRKHLVTLKATTLRTLLEPDGMNPPVLPLGSYDHNKSEKIIRIRGGGEIVYFGLDQAEKIGSYSLTGVAVDEAVEITRDDFTQLVGRIRVAVEGLHNQLYMACNPAAPTHFLAEKFGLAQGHQIAKDCRVIQTKSADNFFLPQDYIDSLNEFTGLAHKRYVEGLWVGSEGIIYDRFDRHTFVRHRDSNNFVRCIVGADSGYTNPSVQLLVRIDGDGNLHIAEEYYKTKQLESSVIEHAKQWNEQHNVEVFVVDPSAASLIAGMRAAGLYVEPANNQVFSGIQCVQARLVVAGNGVPRLTIEPHCVNTIREFETYEWKTSGGEVRDVPLKSSGDHAMDALRYLTVHCDSVLRTAFSLDASTSERDISTNDEPPANESWYDDEDESWENL